MSKCLSSCHVYKMYVLSTI